MVTIKDIARACDLSPTSISLILNNRPNRLSEETKKRVKETAERLNFRPNQIAVGLVTGHTHTIGLILPDVSNLFFASIALEIEKKAAKYGFSLILGNTNDSGVSDILYLNMFLDKGVDGIIFLRSSHLSKIEENTIKNIIINCPKPVVLVDRYFTSVTNLIYTIDQIAGGYMATKHLLELGHKKIGCLIGSKQLVNTKERIIGYKKALLEYEIPFDPSLIIEGNYHLESGVKAFPLFMEKKVSAIFAFNDMMAFGLYQAARNENIKIPDELSIIGFDDNIFSTVLDVPLTSVYQQTEQMAKDATSALINLINGDAEKDKGAKYMPVLISRKSTGRVKITH